MKTSRRTFVKNITGGVAGAIAIPSLLTPATLPQILQSQTLSPNDPGFWKNVRDQFPLSHERVYFNTGTIGPSPFPVQTALINSIEDLDKRGEYGGWEEARPKLAHFLNVDKDEISLTHNTTEAINILVWGLPLKQGDEVILTTHEHVGNALPWINRAKLDGIVLKTFSPAPTAEENLDRINDLITPKTRVIAIPHITCTIGQVFPVKEIAALGHSKGLWVFFDGAQAPGMFPVDLKDIGCDFYAASCHKWMCAPRGTGVLYVKKEMLEVVQTRFVGGYTDIGWDLTVDPHEFKGYVPTAHRYDYGTQSAPTFIGVAAAVDFLNGIGMEVIGRHGMLLATSLQEQLIQLGENVEMLTPTEAQSRGSIIGFRLKNLPNDKFGELASKNGFRIRLVPESHLNSVRISTHMYNNEEEVSRFIEVVKEAIKG